MDRPIRCAGFLQYNSTRGFVDAAFTATNSFGASNGADIVNLTHSSTTITGTQNIWALRTAGALVGGTVNIGSGGLILAGSGANGNNLVSTTNINFGSAEGVIYTAGLWNELDGTISGTGGLTFGSPYGTGPGSPDMYTYVGGYNGNTPVGGNNPNLAGQITIDMGIVLINSAAAGRIDQRHLPQRRLGQHRTQPHRRPWPQLARQGLRQLRHHDRSAQSHRHRPQRRHIPDAIHHGHVRPLRPD